MFTRKIIFLSAALGLCASALAQENRTEPTRIRIGETIISLQSPLHVRPAEQDADTDINIFAPRTYRHRSYPRYSEEMYIGFGFAVPTREESYQPVYSGSSFNLEIGFRYLYRPSQNYAIGTFLQYGCYSYRLQDASLTFLGDLPKGDIYREYFRTDNIGTGIIQRIGLFRRSSIETILYGDFAYSKRFIVKSRVDGQKTKDKHRDGTKFNPFGAGAQIGLRWSTTSLYARYRFTNFFNPDYISPELPRFSIGLCFTM